MTCVDHRAADPPDSAADRGRPAVGSVFGVVDVASRNGSGRPAGPEIQSVKVAVIIGATLPGVDRYRPSQYTRLPFIAVVALRRSPVETAVAA